MKHACHMLSAPKCMVLVTVQLYNHAILSLSLSEIRALSLSSSLVAFASFPTGPARVEVKGGFCQALLSPCL